MIAKDLTVLVPSIPERAEMLQECLASIAAQTEQPGRIVVSVDNAVIPIHTHHNSLMAGVETPWVMYFADDDLMMPTYVETVMRWARALMHPAVVWTYTKGEYPGYRQEFSRELLLKESIVSGAAVFSTELFEAAGRFRDEFGADWEFWKRLAANPSVKFHSISEELVEYRYHGANHSLGFRRES